MLTPRIASAVALLALAIASAGAPQLAQAQACPATTPSQQTVCNINEARGDEAIVGAVGGTVREIANGFTTGNSPHGYLLRSVVIDIERSLNPMGNISVAIHDAEVIFSAIIPRSNPLGTLNGPTRPPSGQHAYTGSIPLSPNTDYFVVVRSPNDTNNSRGYRLEVTQSENQASNGGWLIFDQFRRRLASGWDLDDDSALRFAVVADINAPKGITDDHGAEPLTLTEDGSNPGFGTSPGDPNFGIHSTHQYTLILNAPPSALGSNVIITPSSDPLGTVTFDKTQVTFNIDNWNSLQTIRVTAVQDEIAYPGGERAATIHHAISGDDSGYSALAGPTISVVVIDDDGDPGPPFAPTGVTATAGNAQITLDWTAPRDGGSPITGYEICALESFLEANCTGDALTAITDAAATSGAATGLTNGVTYTLAVRAVNALGNGAFSATVSATPELPLSSCPAMSETRETVCNIDRMDNDGLAVGQQLDNNQQAANAFTTGGNENGYYLQSVRIHVTGKVLSPDDFEVRICNAAGSGTNIIPGTSCNMLSGPASPGIGYHEYTGNIVLEDGITYFLLLRSTADSGVYGVGGTDLSDETGSAGWSINDNYLQKVGSGAWERASFSIRFTVIADVIAPAGVTASVDELTINESGSGNSATYTLVLDSPPSADVRVNATSISRDSPVAFTPNNFVTFSPGNWDTPKPITITADDDSIDNPGDQRTTTIDHSIISDDDGYDDLTVSDLPILSVVVIDDDAPEVSCLTEMERGTNEHACNLDEDADAAFAFVGYDSSSRGYQQVANAFTTGGNENGYLLRSVQVNFVPNSGSPGNNLRVAIHAQNGSVPADDPVENDVLFGTSPPDDGPQTYTASGDIELTDATTYHLVLSAPNAPTSGTNGYRAALTNTMQAASPGWSIADGSLQQQTSNPWLTLLPSNALHFGILAEPIVGLIASTDTLTIDEAGPGNKGEYTLVLDSEPSADVVIEPTIEPRVAALSTTRLTFTAANWNTPSTITVTAIDDSRGSPDNRRTAIITHAVTTTAAFTDTLPSVTVTVADDDDPALRLKLRVFLESALP